MTATSTAALHSQKTNSWGTPLSVVEMAREVMDGIDVDIASSSYWNRHVVKAKRFMTDSPSILDAPECFEVVGDRVFCNPPGGLVREFWATCWRMWLIQCKTVFWVGFSLEQLTYLSRLGLHDPRLSRCVPSQRLRFLQSRDDAVAKLREKAAKLAAKDFAAGAGKLLAEADRLEEDLDGPPVEGDAPTHGNYLVLLPQHLEETQRFEAACEARGWEAW